MKVFTKAGYAVDLEISDASNDRGVWDPAKARLNLTAANSDLSTVICGEAAEAFGLIYLHHRGNCEAMVYDYNVSIYRICFQIVHPCPGHFCMRSSRLHQFL